MCGDFLNGVRATADYYGCFDETHGLVFSGGLVLVDIGRCLV